MGFFFNIKKVAYKVAAKVRSGDVVYIGDNNDYDIYIAFDSQNPFTDDGLKVVKHCGSLDKMYH